MKEIDGRVADVYQFLLRLYPMRVQQDYGEEMAAVFREACQDATKISGWAVCKLGLYEMWDLPGNLIREYASEIGRNVMNSQINPVESLPRSIFRGSSIFGIAYALFHLIYCLLDTLLNSGKTLAQDESLWYRLYLNPTALALSLGAAIMAFNYGKRKVWLSALAVFIAHTLYYRIWVAAFQAQLRISPPLSYDMFLTPTVFATISGILVGGVIGFILYGWKKAGWFACAGMIGFNLGWVAQMAVTYFVLRQCPYTGNFRELVIGDTWYFLYFVLPVIFYGGIVGMCMGITTVGVNRRLIMANHT